MQSNVVGKSLNTQYGFGLPPSAKHQAKSNGPGAGGDLASQCAAWVEANSYYHQLITGGASPFSPEDTALFMQYWDYAYGTAFGSSWGDPLAGGGVPGAGSYPPGQGQSAAGGMFYDSESATINASGQAMVHDSYAYTNILNFPSTMTQVSYEVVMDTRLQPAGEALRVVARNPQTGAEEVFYFHNFRDPDFSLSINTVQGKGVNSTPIDGIDITVGEYDPNAASGSNSADAATMVQNIISASMRTGNAEEQMLTALAKAGFNFETIEDLYRAIEEGTFPPALDADPEKNGETLAQLLDFLNIFDTTMQEKWEKITSSTFTDLPKEERDALLEEYRDYAASVLHMFYPNSMFDTPESPYLITIDGEDYLWTKNSDGEAVVAGGEIDFFGDLNTGGGSDAADDAEAAEEAEQDAADQAYYNEHVAPAENLIKPFLHGLAWNTPQFYSRLVSIYGAATIDRYAKDGVITAEGLVQMVSVDKLIPPAAPDQRFVQFLSKMNPIFIGAMGTVAAMASALELVKNSLRNEGVPDFLIAIHEDVRAAEEALYAAQGALRDLVVSELQGIYGSQVSTNGCILPTQLNFNGQLVSIIGSDPFNPLQWN